MSKYFDVDVFGNYGLITSIITILIFVLGLDFYNFSIRDILKTTGEQEIINHCTVQYECGKHIGSECNEEQSRDM